VSTRPVNHPAEPVIGETRDDCVAAGIAEGDVAHIDISLVRAGRDTEF
jgi:hypothetical protein